MSEIKDVFTVAGYNAYVLIPQNANGEWLWKTEFFHAFEKAEVDLYNAGYSRAYFEISDKYGSDNAVELMYAFFCEVLKRYPFLARKCHLIGFSRGGLYAFNFALKYSQCVKSVYLDAPVLDLRSWPRTDAKFNELDLHEQVMQEYGFSSEAEFENYANYPVNKFEEFFALNIPTLLVSGSDDTTVSYSENSQKMVEYSITNGAKLTFYIKLGADHHPHSFGNVGGTDMYGRSYPDLFKVYSSEFEKSSYTMPSVVKSDTSYIIEFFKKIAEEKGEI